MVTNCVKMIGKDRAIRADIKCVWSNEVRT